jgi:hypothetical protein
MNFVLIEPSIWRLSNRLDAGRKSRLLAIPFLEIVDRLVASVRWTRCHPQPLRTRDGYTRAELELKFPTDLADLFHNGAGGYRAQYYEDMELGERANRHAIEALFAKLKQLPIPKGEHDCEWDFIEVSLSDPDAKIWISEEGPWYWNTSEEAQNLSVSRWLQNAPRIADRTFERWHPGLTPDDEPRLEIKGGALDDKLVGGIVLKPFRSEDVHDLGFT